MYYSDLSPVELRKKLKLAKPFLKRLHNSETRHAIHTCLGEASSRQLLLLVYLIHVYAKGDITISDAAYNKLTISKRMKSVCKIGNEDGYLAVVKPPLGEKFVRKNLMRFLMNINQILRLFTAPIFEKRKTDENLK